MKIILQQKSQFLLRFDYQEDFLPVFRKFLRAQKIKGAFFCGLGAFLNPELAYYDLKKKKYLSKKFKGVFEVASLIGNAAMKKNEIIIHCHLVLSGRDCRAFSGHLINARVGGTLELFLVKLKHLNRCLDQASGLNILNLN